jgi:hypothetical protein
MAFGPGKYDHLATLLRQQTHAKGGVALVIFDGSHGNGFSVQGTPQFLVALPAALREIAAQIDVDIAIAVGDEEGAAKVRVQ